MRVLLDGEFFAEWEGKLSDLANFAQIDVSRLSWDPEDVAKNARSLRRAAYFAESDPLRNEILFDALQSGYEPDMQPWVAKVQEIKARFPLNVA